MGIVAEIASILLKANVTYTLLAACLVLYIIYKSFGGNWPPGPPSLPIVGSLPFLPDRNIVSAVQKLAGSYGDVFTFRLRGRRTIVLSGYDVIKEAIVTQGLAFSGRPKETMNMEFRKQFGLITADGDKWLKHRRYVLRMLKDNGWGKSPMEEIITTEIQHLVDAFESELGHAFSPFTVIQKAVTNNIHMVTLRKRFGYDDASLIKLMDCANGMDDMIAHKGALLLFPFLRKIPGDLIGNKSFSDMTNHMRSQYREWIEEAKSGQDAGNSNHLVSAYMKELEVQRDNEFNLSEDNLLWTVFDLGIAGIDTSSHVISWILLYLMTYPTVQEKLFLEIKNAIGSCAPTMQDRSKLPYTCAVISEVLRISGPVPMPLQRITLSDVTLKGYHIPQGTNVMLNVNGLHKDPRVWSDPDKFIPERFLDENGKFQTMKELIPFSLGKRLCIGILLAQWQIFLITAALLQKFKFSPQEGAGAPDLVGVLGITYHPKPFDVVLKPRF